MMTLAPAADYAQFLAGKRLIIPDAGLQVPEAHLHPWLFPFQRRIVQWALQRGRAACFAGTGLGKTGCQLEWSKHVHTHTGRDVLIFAPLAVTHQTAQEGAKLDLHVTVCRGQIDVKRGVNIANYEMLEHFDAAAFGGLVIDESSILKAYSGSTRKALTRFGAQIPFRLACTATPAPNDLIEIINHAEFLGIMNGKEIIALFFTQDGNTTHKWRLKGHARADFWRWMASWSLAIRSPSDMGYPDDGFILPPLSILPVEVECDTAPPGMLFPVEAQTLEEMRGAMRASLTQRVAACAERVNASAEPWVVWCTLNDESAALARAIPDAVEVRGSDTLVRKERALLDFSEGRVRVLVSKASICGFGMNWQHCARVAFVGLSFSFEQYFQAIRRCWRFGQTRPVECSVITSSAEGRVVAAIERKEKQATKMLEEIVGHMQGVQLGAAGREESEYHQDAERGSGWMMLLGDSVERLAEIDTASVGLALFSPPFPGLYVYSNSRRDVGNVKDVAEMMEHFRFLVSRERLMRTLMPGRLCAVHLCQLTAMLNRDGYIGLKDFRGEVIRMMIEEGWIFHGEVTIEKNPQVQAVRNKDRGLLFKSLANDSAQMRMALADYLILFRKPGENPHPIHAGMSKKYNPGGGWITEREWVEWASPVWWRHTKERPGGIRETDVLNVEQARETNDERHLCPTQICVVERAVKLWTNPEETVCDPFAGIGSVGVGALRYNRHFIGCELKASYYASACRNLRAAVHHKQQGTLIDWLDAEDAR